MKSVSLMLLNLVIIILFLTSCNTPETEEENLMNKINIINDKWINYEGVSENHKGMNQSQFIPYNPDYSYEISHDTYVSYFNGEKFIRTNLYEDTPVTIDKIEKADGIILSFNKENKSGMQLTRIE